MLSHGSWLKKHYLASNRTVSHIQSPKSDWTENPRTAKSKPKHIPPSQSAKVRMCNRDGSLLYTNTCTHPEKSFKAQSFFVPGHTHSPIRSQVYLRSCTCPFTCQTWSRHLLLGPKTWSACKSPRSPTVFPAYSPSWAETCIADWTARFTQHQNHAWSYASAT